MKSSQNVINVEITDANMATRSPHVVSVGENRFSSTKSINIDANCAMVHPFVTMMQLDTHVGHETRFLLYS